MAEQAAARTVRWQWYPPHVIATYSGNSIVSRQILVQPGVIGVEKSQDAEITGQHIGEQQFGLAPKSLAQLAAEGRILRQRRVQFAQPQPLRSKIVHQCRRLGILEQATRLRCQHVRLVQSAGGGDIEQLLVGDAAPQEER